MTHSPDLPPQPVAPFQDEDGQIQQPAPASVPSTPGDIKPSFPQPYPDVPHPGPDNLQP